MPEMQAPAPQGQPQPAPGQQQGGGMGGLVGNVAKGLSMIGTALEKGGAPGPVLERYGAVVQEFSAIMEELQGGGEEQPPPQAGGTVSPEQGGNRGAVPAGQMRRA